MRTKMTLSLLFLSAACGTPTLANYFYNPHANIALNIGAAPSPTPRDIRENRLPKIVHAAPPYANAVADSATKNTRKPAMNDQPSAQDGGGCTSSDFFGQVGDQFRRGSGSTGAPLGASDLF